MESVLEHKIFDDKAKFDLVRESWETDEESGQKHYLRLYEPDALMCGLISYNGHLTEVEARQLYGLINSTKDFKAIEQIEERAARLCGLP